MKIDAETARYYSGLGDLVMLAWLAHGAHSHANPMVFHRKRDLALTSLLNLAVDDQPGGICLDDVYRQEVADNCRKPRIEYIREFLGLESPLLRPALRIDDVDQRWANERAEELGHPLVLLFPQSAWKPREWPANYWIDLAWKLK